MTWWRDAVVYEIYLRSFADGNGDGIGDLAGLRSRLPYLRDLCVDALWITPWYPSPMADGGYDVADYRGIDPMFGTLADAEELIEAAHEHGLRLIVDLVPNHTSEKHPWFQAALAAGPGSPERERYVFRDEPNDWRSVFGGSAWTRVADGQWYLHLFASAQPDLNWSHPGVRTEFEDILRFWLDRGVDGFRIDVAHGLVKDPALPDIGPEHEGLVEPPDRADHPHWDRDGVHEIYRSWRRISETYGGERIFVAEAWVDRPDRLARYVRPDELHTAFNFDFLRCEWDAGALRTVIDTSLAALGEVGAPATWVLSNHDVTRHVSRYGVRAARAAVLLMHALPGGVYVYQGEELGLEEVDLPPARRQDIDGRDGCRIPLPWKGSAPPFGFGGDPWLPQPAHWQSLTAQAQEADPGSMLALYRKVLALRHEHPALGSGSLSWLDSPDGVLAFRREPGLLCVVNVSGCGYRLPEAEVLLASEPLPDATLLPPGAAVWLNAGFHRS
ncbi:glycoside hydrolase family 13 protein [Amycolatopsis sp. K13G38]|uniref:Glycoside hydrolase family 13 protein n=1 Tax=Amycolatopsis acididurans TaxID=2724524 RepID=A0ABX1JDU6_9PSEU|nr:glycoside hydrolase family 13 protein [Amycolatopsis acididurans]NKQ57416.1 glycoside hydrolase family 13 protein [Amycolatopsis acididurans]